MVDRDEFVARLKRKLDEWNADIEQLEIRMQKSSGKVREEYRQLLEGVREKRDHVDGNLRDLRRSMGDAWRDLREGLEEAGDDLRDAIADARQRLKRHEDE